MDTQVRNAKAVVDIDEVHLYKHVAGEPTINQALLDATEGWFSTTTLKGSVEVTQDSLSLTKINIDQSNMPIGISTEPGDFNISFQIPDWSSDSLTKWLVGGDGTALKVGNAQGYGYKFASELTDAVLALKAKTGEWFIFPNIQGSVVMQQADTAWVLGFNGMVLAATNADNQDVYVLADAVVAGE